MAQVTETKGWPQRLGHVAPSRVRNPGGPHHMKNAPLPGRWSLMVGR